jgi:uncharacterized protein YoxC
VSDHKKSQSIQLSTDCMERFADTFEVSARRWELIVYPSLVAFIVLAIYGFYLIYSLTKDVHELTHTVTTLTGTVDRNMTTVATNMDLISGDMQLISGEITQISTEMQEISQDTKVLLPINANMAQMQYSAAAMALHTRAMQQDMRNVSGPMAFVNSFFPGR